jgi:hypothetical protein
VSTALRIDGYNIGKSFPEGILKEAEYNKIEATYLEAIKLFSEENNLLSFGLNSIEPAGFYKIGRLRLLEKTDCSLEDALLLAQSILRQVFWAKLHTGSDFEIHFGYDYCMFFIAKSSQTSLINKINSLGIYCEIIASPYKQLST